MRIPSVNRKLALISIWLIVSTACSLPGLNGNRVATLPAAEAPAAQASPQPSPTAQPTPLPDLPPALVESDPLTGGVLPPSGPLTLTFNVPMDRASVEGALQLQPATPGSFEWSDDSTRVSFRPDQALSLSARIEVQLAATARSAAGLALPQPLTLTYHTPQPLTVSERLPQPGLSDADPRSAVVATFNTPVVALGGDPADLPPAFSLEPPAAGRSEWLNTSTFIFYPDPGLAGGATYQVKLNPQLSTALGVPLGAESAQSAGWSFSTARPLLTGIDPAGGKSLNLDGKITLTFNQAMDPDSVAQNLSLQNTGTAGRAPIQLNWNDTHTELTVQPDGLLERSANYMLILLGQAHSLGGSPLGEDQIYSYPTVGNMGVAGTTPAANQTLDAGNGFGSLTIRFTTPLTEGQALKDLVLLSPQVESQHFYLDNTSNSLYVSGIFKNNTLYTLKVAAALKDRWGQPLPEDFDFRFLTSAAQPTFTIPLSQLGQQAIFLTPNDRGITARVTNVRSIRVSSNRLTTAQFLELYNTPENQRSALLAAPTSTWNQGLKTTANLNEGVNMLLGPAGKGLDTGLYYYRIYSAELDRQKAYYTSSFMAVVSRVQINAKFDGKRIFVWAVNLDDNTPLPDLQVFAYTKENKPLGTATTDEHGLATIELVEAVKPYDPLFLVSGKPGDANFALATTAWNQDVQGWSFGIQTELESGEPYVYLYTDRPIYRPGQTINFRAVARQRSNGRYSPIDQASLTFHLKSGAYDPSGQYPDLGTLSLPLSAYGTATGAFDLPETAQPGIYRIEVDGAPSSTLNLQVALYRKPEIDLNVKFAAPEVRPGSPLQARVEARYYFGAPAGGVKLNWSLYAHPEDLSLPGGYQTGKADTSWVRYIPDAFAGGETYLKDGQGVTGPDGVLTIDLPPEIYAGMDAEQRQRLTLQVVVQETSEYPVSDKGETIFVPADFTIGLRTSAWSLPAKSELGVDVLTAKSAEAVSGDHALTGTLSKITWQDTGAIYYGVTDGAFVPEYTQVASADLRTDSAGRARLAFTPPSSGIYLLDVRGEGAVSQSIIWVSGEGQPAWPRLPNNHIQVEADAGPYQAGQTANLFIPNPFPQRALALVTVERGTVMRSEVLELQGASAIYQLPLTEADAPNVFVSVLLLGQNDAGRPDFALGYREIKVTPTAETLQVALSAQPEQAGPGDEVTFSVDVKDSAGQPVQGEFSLGLVDQAVLALADPNAPDILPAFYNPQPLGVTNSLSLSAYAGRFLPVGGFGRGGGGGGADAFGLRQNFQDTAYWNGGFETNPDGKAELRMKLPDNLTTWVADVRGLTRDTRVGSQTRTLTVNRPLMIRPAVPRFLVAGDRVQLAATVHNQTGGALQVDVSLQATGVALEDPAQAVQKIDLPAGERRRVTWWATAQSAESADLVFTAHAGELTDSARPEHNPLPIHRYAAPQTFGTAGVLTSAGEQIELIGLPRSYTPTGGELRVELSPSLAATILADLQTLENQPPDLTEAGVSQLLPNVETLHALQELGLEAPALKNRLQSELPKLITRLEAAQNSDGGWGWTSGVVSSEELSAYVIYGLSRAAAAGLSVSPGILQKGQNYLIATLIIPGPETQTWALNRLAFQNYALWQSGRTDINPGLLVDYRSRLNPWAQAMLALTLAGLDANSASAKTLIADLEATAARSSSGAYWPDGIPDPVGLTSPNFSTAVVVLALSRLDPAAAVLTDAVRYLALNRRAGGGWSCSYETAWTLLALTENLKGTGDLNASYAFSAALNGSDILTGQAGGPTALTAVTSTTPLSGLAANRSNPLMIRRDGGEGRLYYRALLQLFRPVETAVPLDRGISITRRYYLGGQDCRKQACQQIDAFKLAEVNQPIVVRITLTVPQNMNFVTVEDFIPAGAEVADPSLKTTPKNLEKLPFAADNPFDGGWGWWVFGRPQVYDDHVRWVAESVSAGTYELTYQLTPLLPGEYRTIPAHAWQMYFPDVEGTTSGGIFRILPAE